MPHPLVLTTALLGGGLTLLRLFRREQERVREALDRVRRQEGLDALPAQRLERDPSTGIYRLPDDRTRA